MPTRETPLTPATFTVSVTFGEPQASIEVSTSSINFGSWIPPASLSKSFTISNRGNKALTVSSISVPAWCTIDTSSAVLSAGQTITLKLTPISNPPGLYTGTVTIINDGINGTQTIDLSLNIEQGGGTRTLTGTPGTWTVPTGVYTVKATLIGGGGGGGYSSINNNQNSGGGGGSGQAVTETLNVTPGQIFNYSIGIGGAAGVAADPNYSLTPLSGELYLQGNKSNNWSAYMKTNAVWVSAAGNDFGTFAIYRIFEVQTAGTYYYRSLVDNSAEIYIDSKLYTNYQAFSAASPTRYALNLTAGYHLLKLVVTNATASPNPAGISFIVTDSTDTNTVYDLKTDLSPDLGKASVHRADGRFGETTFFYSQNWSASAEGGGPGKNAPQNNSGVIAPGGIAGPGGEDGQDGEQIPNNGISTRPGGGKPGAAIGGRGGAVSVPGVISVGGAGGYERGGSGKIGTGFGAGGGGGGLDQEEGKKVTGWTTGGRGSPGAIILSW